MEELRIVCECGAAMSVGEGAAGARLACACGRTIAVPSLQEFRRQAGIIEPLPSPDLAIQALLAAGRLPEETHCVSCGMATPEYVICRVECEKAFCQGGASFGSWLLAFLTFGLFGIAVVASQQETVHGEDRVYHLPLRLCLSCRPQLTDAGIVKKMLARVPWYERLLQKYPRANVSI